MSARRVALVSGASRGIGLAAARRLQAEGWDLSLGLRTPSLPPGLDPAADLQRHDALAGDEAAWVEAALARFGRIDAVVCCAGVMEPRDVIEVDDETLDRMWEINVKSPRRLARAAWAPLLASGCGRAVILASLSGKRVKSAASGSYALTKHAAVALAHALRQAGWDQGLRATAICPGLVATDMARAISDLPDEDMTRPEEVARLVSLALDLPNSAGMAEMHVNCLKEEFF